MSNFIAEATAQGQHATQRLLGVEEALAPVEVAERLAVPVHAPVVVRHLLFVIDDEPMQLCDGYYRADLFRGTAVAEPRRIKGGVHAVIEDPDGPIRARIAQFVEDLDVRLPLPAVADVLAIPEGVPIVRVLRTAYDQDARPLEVLDSLVPSDRYSFRYVIDIP